MSDERLSDDNSEARITLSLGSGLLSKVNENYRETSQAVAIDEGMTIDIVLQRLGLPSNMALLVILNDALVQPSQLAHQALANGDRLSVMPPIHAG
jgi:sulfur carrier protein ThiS